MEPGHRDVFSGPFRRRGLRLPAADVAMTPPRLVLLRPRNAENLGAIARAMKNFGFTDWVVVSPNPELLEGPGTQRLAVKSGDVLESVWRADSLAEAVGTHLGGGTTMRRIEGRARLAPRALARAGCGPGAPSAGRWSSATSGTG